MRNLKVSMKLLVGFGVMILLAVLVGTVGITGMSILNQASSDMYEDNILAIEAMADIREAFRWQRSEMRNIFLNWGVDDAAVQVSVDAIAQSEALAQKQFLAYEDTITDQTLEDDYFTAKDAWQGIFTDMKRDIFAQLDAGDYDAAYQIFKDVGPLCVEPIANGLAGGAALNSRLALDANEYTNSLFTMLLFVLIGVLVFAAIVAVLLALSISGMIAKPLSVFSVFMLRASKTGDISLTDDDRRSIGKFTQARDEIGSTVGASAAFVERVIAISEELDVIANGDLTRGLPPLSEKDVIGQSLQKVTANLNNMFRDIHNSTAQVATGAKQIADGAQSLAQGSTEQASTVQELSASISEIADKTRANAELATKASHLANDIRTSAERGNTQMGEMTVAVQEINEASQNIRKVMGVIEQIAFQTNILALNASVEAARAGQHGRGFAVVAEEVRSLAAKSDEAAKETGGLIQNSMEKAEHGARIAGETAESLAEIVAGIEQSAQIMTEIATASEEQAVGITNVNIGIDQVAQVVQQNSATAEESAAASEEMSSQSNLLEEMISQFRIKDSGSTLPGGTARRQLASATNTGAPAPRGNIGKY